jgi:hypothetical protein
MFDPIQTIAEERITEAEKRGEFDNLPKRGRLNLDDYFRIPEELRMAYTVLRNSGHIDENTEPSKDIQTSRDLLEHLDDEGAKQRQLQRLDIIGNKIGQIRGEPLRVDEDSDYYAKVTDRVEVRKKGK